MLGRLGILYHLHDTTRMQKVLPAPRGRRHMSVQTLRPRELAMLLRFSGVTLATMLAIGVIIWGAN